MTHCRVRWLWSVGGCEMSDELRRTGRTTRALEDCVERARKGETVVYVMPWAAFTDVAHRILMEMPGVTLSRHGTYNVWGGGTIRLVAYEAVKQGRLRGLNAHVAYDHAVWDVLRIHRTSVKGEWVK